MVPKLRTSLLGRRPAAPRMTQATTEPWCTSSPAARSISASIATSRGGGRGAAGRKTEAGPRADRTNRSRPSVVPERGADRSLVRGRMPPTHHRPPRVRHPTCWRGGTLVHPGPIFSSEAVRGMRWASLVWRYCRALPAEVRTTNGPHRYFLAAGLCERLRRHNHARRHRRRTSEVAFLPRAEAYCGATQTV